MLKYSQLRSHQYNGWLTPKESERLFFKNSKTVASFCWPLSLYREKFQLPEFITSIGDFIKSIGQNCRKIKQQLVEIRNNIDTVKLAIEQVQGNVSPVVQSSPVHQNTDSNSGERLSRPSNR